jgi:hypothetical protein
LLEHRIGLLKVIIWGSKITICSREFNVLYDVIVRMVNLEYLDINTNCVYEKGWGKEHAIKFYKQSKKYLIIFYKMI